MRMRKPETMAISMRESMKGDRSEKLVERENKGAKDRGGAPYWPAGTIGAPRAAYEIAARQKRMRCTHHVGASHSVALPLI